MTNLLPLQTLLTVLFNVLSQVTRVRTLKSNRGEKHKGQSLVWLWVLIHRELQTAKKCSEKNQINIQTVQIGAMPLNKVTEADSQKPNCCSENMLCPEIFCIVLSPSIKEEIAHRVRKIISSETDTLPSALGRFWTSSCFTTLRIHQVVSESGVFLANKKFWQILMSLQHCSASASKQDCLRAVMQLMYVKWNLTSSSSVSYWGSIKKF